MPAGLIVHLILCVLGTAAGAFLAMGSLISIANMKNVPWVTALLIGAVLVPVMWLGSGVAAWVLHSLGSSGWYRFAVILPWAYTAAFIGAMLYTFHIQP